MSHDLEEPAATLLPAGPPSLDDPALYLNRELSWLDFNDRVLEEARDPRNPLLERVRFLAITASNLDEFYAKRVGWLKRQVLFDPSHRTCDGADVRTQHDEVLTRCHEMIAAMDSLWATTLRPALADARIRIVAFDALAPDARRRLAAQFRGAIFPVLTPLVVDPAHPFPFISSESLSMAVEVQSTHGQSRFARVKLPPNVPRFVDAGDGQFVLLEEVIGAHLDLLFPGVAVSPWRMFRVVRNAEIGAPGEELEDLRELIENELVRRRLADAVMIEAARDIPTERIELLMDELELTEQDIVYVDHFVGMADLAQLATLADRPDLAFPAFTPEVPPPFDLLSEDEELFPALREREVLVFHPFESFDETVARFVEEAAQDRRVLAIKQTLYRTSPDSPILESLIRAANRGTQVAVVVELTARFDEANNIEWARRLEQAGVHVAYGSLALKVHSKLSLVVRQDHDGVTLYSHIGTGNYNSRTAKVYSDLGLFSADPAIGQDLLAVFNRLTGFSEQLRTTDLLVAPDALRSEFEWRVRREIEHARAGKPARLVFKMNALEDPPFTRLLYEASMAGVEVDLIVRGLCRLRPGLPGVSDHVRVISVIGRFLEHSRIYYFANDGAPEMFIGSADLMKRNLDERIEVMAPVRDAELRERLWAILEAQLGDRRQGWELRDATWHRDPAATGTGVHERFLRDPRLRVALPPAGR